MPEDSNNNSSKMSWSLTITLLLLGHATTAAWNSFLNNEEYFKFKLRGGKAAESSEQADESNQLNCSMIIARYGNYSMIGKGLNCDEGGCSQFSCELDGKVNIYNVEKSKAGDKAFKKQVATVFDDFDVERNWGSLAKRMYQKQEFSVVYFKSHRFPKHHLLRQISFCHNFQALIHNHLMMMKMMSSVDFHKAKLTYQLFYLFVVAVYFFSFVVSTAFSILKFD